MSKATAKERHEAREKLRQSMETVLAKEGEIRNSLRDAAWDALETVVVGLGIMVDQVEEIEADIAALKGEPPETRHKGGAERTYAKPREERRVK
jgi:hypothetical protein